MAKKHCVRCGEELSKQEQEDLKLAEEQCYPVERPMCEDCLEKANSPTPDNMDMYDDASGL